MTNDDGSLERIPNLDLAALKFQYGQLLALGNNANATATHTLKAEILVAIEKEAMTPFYKYLGEELKWWPIDPSLVAKMTKVNEETVASWDFKRDDAEKNLGDTEILDALLGKANYYCQIADKNLAVASFKVVEDKTGSLGTKMDICFAKIRLGILYGDNELINQNIEKAKKLLENGGDWDRRNRLKVYEGLYRMSIRDFKTSATLFLDALSTFTCSELISYKDFIRYTIITTMVGLDRVTIKKKLITSPEVMEVIHEIHPYGKYMNSLYECKYKEFFESLAEAELNMKKDMFLFPHYRYIVREMRILAYSQLLESYRSLTLDSMAKSFGVSPAFIDKELSRFIALGRLNCVIDKVKGIVETNRPDHKNSQYQSVIRQGDFLLNRMQKLSRVIHL